LQVFHSADQYTSRESLELMHR